MHLVSSYASGQYVIVIGRLTDRATGRGLGGRAVCLTFEVRGGGTGMYGCTETGKGGYVGASAWEGGAVGILVRFRWERRGGSYRALSFWTSWYRADAGRWTLSS
jgi:hypothetical protein